MVHIPHRRAYKTHTHPDRRTPLLSSHGRMLVRPDKLRDTNMPSLKSYLRKNTHQGGEKKKKEIKLKHPISLPHPQFQTACQVIGSPCWNTLECLLHGGLPASPRSTQWISLKTTSERFFQKGQPSLDMKFQLEHSLFNPRCLSSFALPEKIWIDGS